MFSFTELCKDVSSLKYLADLLSHRSDTRYLSMQYLSTFLSITMQTSDSLSNKFDTLHLETFVPPPKKN